MTTRQVDDNDYVCLFDLATNQTILNCTRPRAEGKPLEVDSKLFKEAHRLYVVVGEHEAFGADTTTFVYDDIPHHKREVEKVAKAFIQVSCLMLVALESGKNPLPYCKNGRTRSPSMILAFFVLFRGYRLEALQNWFSEAFVDQRPATAASSGDRDRFPNFLRFSPVIKFLVDASKDKTSRAYEFVKKEIRVCEKHLKEDLFSKLFPALKDDSCYYNADGMPDYCYDLPRTAFPPWAGKVLAAWKEQEGRGDQSSPHRITRFQKKRAVSTLSLRSPKAKVKVEPGSSHTNENDRAAVVLPYDEEASRTHPDSTAPRQDNARSSKVAWDLSSSTWEAVALASQNRAKTPLLPEAQQGYHDHPGDNNRTAVTESDVGLPLLPEAQQGYHDHPGDNNRTAVTESDVGFPIEQRSNDAPAATTDPQGMTEPVTPAAEGNNNRNKRQAPTPRQGSRQSKRSRRPCENFQAGEENGKGILQDPNVDFETYRSNKQAVACWWWNNQLKPYGWKWYNPKLNDWGFIPATLATFDPSLIKAHGIDGVHYADGWESLYDMVETFGTTSKNVNDKFPIVEDFDTRKLEELKLTLEAASNIYEGNPSKIPLHNIIMKLEHFELHDKIDYKLMSTTACDDFPCSEERLLSYFVKNGIPGAANLEKPLLKQLEERVKFAYVDCNQLKSAQNNLNGFSAKILTNEEVRPILRQFGFEPDPANVNRFFQPRGKQNGNASMSLAKLRVFIRENENWKADGRRLNGPKPSKEDKFALRLWGATSRDKLPTWHREESDASPASTGSARSLASPHTNGGADANANEGSPPVMEAARGQTIVQANFATRPSSASMVETAASSHRPATSRANASTPANSAPLISSPGTVDNASTPALNEEGSSSAHRVSLDPAEVSLFEQMIKVEQIREQLKPNQWQILLNDKALWGTPDQEELQSANPVRMNETIPSSFFHKMKMIRRIYVSLTPEGREELLNDMTYIGRAS